MTLKLRREGLPWLLSLWLALSIGPLSCGRPEPSSPAPPTAESSRPNLLTLERGSVVTSRTGELRLDAAALHAIDDDPETSWITPPKDPAHTMVVALPVRSLIEQVGVAFSNGQAPSAVVFEGSEDGHTFFPLATIEVSDPSIPEFMDVSPSQATSLRVTIREESDKTVAISSVSAAGTESSPYVQPTLNGRWRIAGKDAEFGQDGNRILGTLATEPPTHIEGTWTARSIQFLYMRGNELGLGVLVVSPDGTFLNGLSWYHKVTPVHVAPVWYGEKTGDGSPGPAESRVIERWLERSGTGVPLFGIAFNAGGDLQVEESAHALEWLASRLSRPADLAVIKRVLDGGEADAAHDAARRQLDSLRNELARRGVDVARIAFDVVGPEDLEHVPAKPLERAMLTGIELRRIPAKDVDR